jgi:GTP cyclohydrolase II
MGNTMPAAETGAAIGINTGPIGKPGAIDAFRNVVMWGISNTRAGQEIGPLLPDNYPDILTSLIAKRENGVTVFEGGTMHMDHFGIEDSWLTPVEIKDREGYTNMNVLWLNCKPGEEPDRVIVSNATSLGLKLGDVNDAEAMELLRFIRSGTTEKIAVIRPDTMGSLYLPNIQSVKDRSLDPELWQQRIDKTVDILGLPRDKVMGVIDPELISCDFRGPWMELSDGVFMAEPVELHTEVGVVYAYTLHIPDDPWGYYQILTNPPLDKLNRNVAPLIRLDSGCVSGQLYLDGGCECREQLIEAIHRIHDDEDDGFIIHVPTQDGRGYGLVTKMVTETMKRGGIPTPFTPDGNGRGPAGMDTIQAAQLVFGEQYDSRTYEGVGRVIKALGYHRVRMMTNNAAKLLGITSQGIQVDREAIHVHKETCDHHVQAKLNTDQYIQ